MGFDCHHCNNIHAVYTEEHSYGRESDHRCLESKDLIEWCFGVIKIGESGNIVIKIEKTGKETYFWNIGTNLLVSLFPSTNTCHK